MATDRTCDATEQATYGDVVTNAADHVGIPREQIDRFLGTLQMCGWQVSPVSETAECEWRQDDDGIYNTGCGNAFAFDSGTATENKSKFCQYCGGTLKAVDYEDRAMSTETEGKA